MDFKGAPYPIITHPNGLLHIETGLETIKADLLQLLLTNPGERVMLMDYGTPLKELFFEPNDTTIQNTARAMIIRSINEWEPRIVVEAIEVGTIDPSALNASDALQDIEHILYIKIRFFDPEDIQEVQELDLQVPLGG